MQVKKEMTANIEFVNPETSVKEVAQKMRDLDIGVLPICQNDKLLGIVTDRDITIRLTSEARDPNSTPVKDVMSSQVEWCFDDEDVNSCAKKMQAKQIRRLAVVNHDQKLVGILSIGDLAKRGSSKVACAILEKVSAPA